MYMIYRHVFRYKLFQDEKRVIQKDKLDEIEKIASAVSPESLSARLGFILDTKKKIKQNAAFQLAMEVLFINIKEN